MSESIIREAVFALHCIAVGVAVTFTYDLLRVFRNCVRHSRFFISLEDFLFWIACAVFLFLVLYCENDGILRWYCIAGAVFGMEVYRKSVSPYIVYFMSTIIKKAIYIAGWILKKVFLPLSLVLYGFRKLKGRICRILTKKKKTDNN